MNYLFTNTTRTPLPQSHLEKWLKSLERELKRMKVWHLPKDFELSVSFVSVAAIKKLNRDYRNRNKPTDVLSFQTTHLGDLVLCPQVIKMQSLKIRWSFKALVSYLVLHGLLHILGFDHEQSEAEAQKMYTLQDSLFEKLYPPK